MSEVLDNACKVLYNNLNVNAKYYKNSIIDKIEFFAYISVPSEDICEKDIAFNNKYKCIDMKEIHTIDMKEFIEKFVENVIDNTYVECHKNIKNYINKNCWLTVGYRIIPSKDLEGNGCDFVEIVGTLVKDDCNKLTSGAIYRWNK